ncbi:hypothetical protein SESBI_47096 [Sesbania bispinosa]|nr:hypothetical protein SESBI_47096 [Sesbania bispinosa]
MLLTKEKPPIINNEVTPYLTLNLPHQTTPRRLYVNTVRNLATLHGYPSKRGNAPSAHHVQTTSHNAATDWIMDSGATHHIKNDLDRLHLSSPYSGSDQLIVGDGSTLPITHTGSEDKGATASRTA